MRSSNEYLHRFRVNASQARVAAFHQQPASMSSITPPPIRVVLQRAPASLSSGSVMNFTLWFGPFPIRWSAGIEDVSEAGFTDRQRSGPFSQWEHRHSFIAVNEHTTEVIDQVSLRLKPHLLWGSIGLGFRLGMPLLFAYRAWKTRRMLERGAKE